MVQPFLWLYDRRHLPFASVIVLINSDVPFKFQVGNGWKNSQWLVKNQVLRSVLPHPQVALPTNNPVAAILGVESSKKGDEYSVNGDRNLDPEF